MREHLQYKMQLSSFSNLPCGSKRKIVEETGYGAKRMSVIEAVRLRQLGKI